MTVAKIEDLKLDHNAILNQDQKKAMVEIIEKEFSSKNTFYDEMRKREEEKIMDAYRKEVNFDKLIKDIEKAEAVLEKAKTQLELIGLSRDGSINNPYFSPKTEEEWQTKKAAEKIYRRLSAIAINAPSYGLKAKIITRMQLARSYGEAMVIMHQVLGNGLLPSLTKEEALQITYKE